jgi:hypothetical protein
MRRRVEPELGPVWLYVGVRDRLGPGPVTAAKTGLAVWAPAYLVPFVGNTLQGMATPRMFWIGVALTIVYVPLATMAGAWVYREAGSAPATAAAAVEPMTHSRDGYFLESVTRANGRIVPGSPVSTLPF